MSDLCFAGGKRGLATLSSSTPGSMIEDNLREMRSARRLLEAPVVDEDPAQTTGGTPGTNLRKRSRTASARPGGSRRLPSGKSYDEVLYPV
jgi:hypothetical protein